MSRAGEGGGQGREEEGRGGRRSVIHVGARDIAGSVVMVSAGQGRGGRVKTVRASRE